MSSLAVIVPAFNEELSVLRVINDLLNIEEIDLIVCVDNNSTDGTARIINEACERTHGRVVYCFESRQGKGYAFNAGIKKCSTYDFVGIIDGDDTYPAEYFIQMYELAKRNRFDMVSGDRFSNRAYASNSTRVGHIAGNIILSKLIKFTSGTNLNDALSGMRLFSRRFLDNFPAKADGFQLETEFSMFCGEFALYYKEIPIEYAERAVSNPSKLRTVRDGFRILTFALLRTSYGLTGRFAILLSIISFLASLFFGFKVIQEFLMIGHVRSIGLSVLTSILFLSSNILFLLAFIENRIKRLENRINNLW